MILMVVGRAIVLWSRKVNQQVEVLKRSTGTWLPQPLLNARSSSRITVWVASGGRQILTFHEFPCEHRRQVDSTDPLERAHRCDSLATTGRVQSWLKRHARYRVADDRHALPRRTTRRARDGADARWADDGPVHGVPESVHRQHGHAAHRQRAERLRAVRLGDHQLHADQHGHRAAARQDHRSVRRTPVHHLGRRLLHHHHHAVRAGSGHGPAHRTAHAAGRRRRHPDVDDVRHDCPGSATRPTRSDERTVPSVCSACRRCSGRSSAAT